MGAVRFEDVDVLDFLGKVVELHTQHYKDDFDIDKELIQNLAACRNGGKGCLPAGQPRK